MTVYNRRGLYTMNSLLHPQWTYYSALLVHIYFLSIAGLQLGLAYRVYRLSFLEFSVLHVHECIPNVSIIILYTLLMLLVEVYCKSFCKVINLFFRQCYVPTLTHLNVLFSHSNLCKLCYLLFVKKWTLNVCSNN